MALYDDSNIIYLGVVKYLSYICGQLMKVGGSPRGWQCIV